MSKIAVGDKVKYRRQFLQSIGCTTGDMPFARGVVVSIRQMSRDTMIASIRWLNGDMPSRVNVKNLTLASDPERV